MKTFENQAAQGDLLITRIDKLPQNLEILPQENNKYIVGHSETMHHHVIAANQANVYRDPQNLFILFVVVDETAMLEHLRSFDTHETLQLKKGIYQINQQREWISEGFRRVAD